MNDPVIFSYGFDGKGGGFELTGDAIVHHLKEDVLAWVHLNAYDPNIRNWLETEIGYLDPLILRALLEDETRPRMIQVGNGLVVILRGVNLNENEEPEDMVSIRMWIDPHRIISIRRRKVKAIEDVATLLRNGEGPCNSGDFLYMLVTRLLERMQPVLDDMQDSVDGIEDEVLTSPENTQSEEIVGIRRQVILLRRHIAPQRDVLHQICHTKLDWIDDEDRRHMLEASNLITRYVEDLDSVRERAQVVKDELASSMANAMNKNMYAVSSLSSIFLPLGFLTGLLGINLGGIPGAEHPQAFWMFCGLLLLVFIAQVIILKKLKWF